MIYLLDANACIKFLNGQSENVRSRLESKRPEEIVLCSVVKAELLYGALKSARPAENLNRLGSFFKTFVSFAFDDVSAETYGAIRVGLERAGTPIGPNDLFIAAIARSRGATLVTNNTREFQRVEGLLLEDWE
jgi:tRNA(fMet)-specific endonuclease VapC